MSTATRNWSGWFYCMGLATTLACFVLILAGNTGMLYRFEHRGFPLSWALAAAAVLAFLAAEFCDQAPSVTDQAEDRASEASKDWAAFEF